MRVVWAALRLLTIRITKDRQRPGIIEALHGAPLADSPLLGNRRSFVFTHSQTTMAEK